MATTAGVANALPNALAAKVTRFLDSTDARLSSTRLLVGAFTVLGLGLRVWEVRGFSLTEATSGYAVRQSLGHLLHAIVHSSVAPINLTVLWIVAHTLGSSPFALRLPSLVFGALTIPMLYLAGRALYGEAVGVLAALVGTIGPLGVWYAQDAGAGAMVILLTTTTLWALRRALSTGRPGFWLAWAAAGAALIWAQWSGALVVAVEVAVAAVAAGRAMEPATGGVEPQDRSDVRRPLTAILLVVAAAALATPVLRAQGHRLGLSHLGTTIHSLGQHDPLSTVRVLGSFVPLLWGFHSPGLIADAVAAWPLLILGALLVLGRARHPSHGWLVAVIGVPLVVAVLARALADPNALQASSLVDTVPAIYLVVAGVIVTAAPTQLARHALAATAGVVLAFGLILQQSDAAVPGLYGYRAAFDQISSVATPSTWIAYAGADLGPVVGYFAPTIHHRPLDGAAGRIPPRVPVLVIAPAGSTPASGPAETASLRQLEHGRRLVAVFRAPHVLVWELS